MCEALRLRDRASLHRIEAFYPPERRIVIGEADAVCFAAQYGGALEEFLAEKERQQLSAYHLRDLQAFFRDHRWLYAPLGDLEALRDSIQADIDKRKKFARTLMSGAAFEFAPLNDGDLTTWARAHLKELKSEVEADVLRRIVELVGSDVRTLSNELNKLSAAALPSAKITMDLVEARRMPADQLHRECSRRVDLLLTEQMNWDLTDQMLARNRPRALRVLEQLLDDGAPPVMLIGLIGSTYRRLALAQSLHSQGVSSRDIFRQVPMPPFKQQSYLATLSRADSRTLARQIARIAAADLGIKTSKATPRMQVEMLVIELTAN